MIFDAEEQFSDKQAVTSTGYSTNSVEIPPGLTAGIDQAVQIIVRSESGTDPTLTVEEIKSHCGFLDSFIRYWILDTGCWINS